MPILSQKNAIEAETSVNNEDKSQTSSSPTAPAIGFSELSRRPDLVSQASKTSFVFVFTSSTQTH